MYAIICEARSGRRLGITRLALVDRSRSRRFWWTSDNPRLVRTFTDLGEAEHQAAKLARNTPRIVSAQAALDMIARQRDAIRSVETRRREERIRKECLDATELGWDAHKTD